MSDQPVPLRGTPGAPRRRYLTMLFSDLSDSTRIAASMETEDYAGLLARLRVFYLDVIPRHGGTIVQIQGDGVLAIFGYPDAREQNGRQATEAALDLHDLVRTLKADARRPGAGGLSLHTGIHAGLILFEEGDLVRGRFELLGSATNIASRLSDTAEPDEILVSEETLGPEKSFFRTGERRALTLKGKDAPMGVFRVLARAPASALQEARSRRGLVPFVGRRAELDTLERNLDAAIAGELRYVAIAAPPGLGKTRLAKEFIDGALRLECEVHRGYCESDLSAEPLQPFLQMLRTHCGLSREMSPALAAAALDQALAAVGADLLGHRQDFLRALSINVPDAADEGKRPATYGTVLAMRDFFDALAARKPLVIFIDDWQWADDVSRQVLHAIRGLAARRILVLSATRGFAAGDVGLSDALILNLDPFSEAESAATISRLLPTKGPFEIGEISRYSGGNPLYIEELCHFSAHQGNRRPGTPRGGVAWLNALIQSRVARLPDLQVAIVRTAAVIGNMVPAWLLERLTGYGEKDPLIEDLAARDFIFPAENAGILRFKHGIARDVIYNSVGLHERKAMHLRIAELLQHESASGGQEESYETLAYHYGEGGNAAEAARYAELAGDKATAVSALDRAVAQYRAALDALDRLEPSDAVYKRWSEISQRLGMACVFDPSRDQLDVLGRAVELATAHRDEAGIARAEYWLGYISYGLGESAAAIRHLDRGLAAGAKAGDERLVAQIRTTAGQARAAACDYDGALALLDEFIAGKRQGKKSSRVAVGFAYSLACKAAVLGDRGSFVPAYACIDEALESIRGSGHEVEGSVRCWQSAVLLWQGRWEDARAAAAEAQRVAERVKSLYLYAMGLSLGAYAGWILERAPGAVQTILEATSWLETRDRGLFISLNYGWLADALVSGGRFAEARRPAAQALLRVRKLDRLGEAMAWRALARSAALGHQRRPFGYYIGKAMAVAERRGSPHEVAATRLCLAEIELARSNRAGAMPLLDAAEAAFRGMRMEWHAAEAGRVRRSG